MSLPSHPAYLNDSVYDGAVIHRCVCVFLCFNFPSSSLFHTPLPCFIIALTLRQCFFPLTSLLPRHHGESKETGGGEWVMVVYLVRQYLIGMTESTTLTEFRNRNQSPVDSSVWIMAW